MPVTTRQRLEAITQAFYDGDYTRTDFIDAILDALMEPSHDVTAAVCEPMDDRAPILRIWNGMIRAIKAGQ